jgi:hypothetical protein
MRFRAQRATELDVVAVIDNSGGVGAQLPFAESFGTFFAALEGMEGTLPDLHVGLTSTNAGAYGQPISACAGDGDDGRFQNAPRRPACEPPAGFFIETDPPNYSAPIGEVFRCIATLGLNGCGYEQPLEAMRRALDGRNPENDGFRRQAAPLLVVILTDEDDCSATGPALFVPEDDPAIGPASSYRCTEFGILCNGQPIGRDPDTGLLDPDDGELACEPQGALRAEEPGYLWHPQVYVDFLRQQVVDPIAVGVALFAGPPEPVEVQADNENHASLAPSCVGGVGEVDPPVRLVWFAEQFGARSRFHNVCDGDFEPPVRRAASLASLLLGSACLPEAVVVSEACRVADAATGTLVPRCDELTQPGPCWRVTADETRCPDTGAHLRIELDVADALAGATLALRCPAPS